jgi:hypothetical protein
MVLAGSGDAKSSVYHNLMTGVIRWQDAGDAQFTNDMAIYTTDKELWEKQRRKALADPTNGRALLINLEQNKPKKPRSRLNTGSKLTTNGIIRSLDEGWSTFGLFADEGGSVLGGHSLKAENSPVEFASALTMLWDKGAADRTTGEVTVRLRGRRLAGLILVQPKVARDFLQNRTFAEQGIHARFSIVQPPRWQPLAEDHTDPQVRARRQKLVGRVAGFADRIEAMLSQALPFVAKSDCVLDPPALSWSIDANKKAVDLIREFIDLRSENTETYWFRLWEHCCRTAGVLAAFEGYPEITLPVLEAAWALTLFFANQWKNLDLDVENERDTRDAPYIDKITKVLLASGPMSERDIARKAMQRVDADVRKRVLTSMVNDERVKVSEVLNGTRKTVMYEVA